MIEMAPVPGGGFGGFEDKYGDIYGPYGEQPWSYFSGGGGGGGYGGGSGGGGFIPTFGGQGGQAQPFGGFPQTAAWGGQRRRMQQPRLAGTRSAFDGGGASMQGGGGPGNAGIGLIRGLGQNVPSAPAPPNPLNTLGGTSNPNWWGGDLGGGPNIVASLIRDAGAGGAFGLNPPAGIMEAVRRQAMQDASARERAARVGLQSRGDADPSTYGFQALMSQLGGQRDTANAMSQADLGLRQQQLGFLQNLLGQYFGGGIGLEQSNIQRQAQQQSPWGQALQGIGSIAGGWLGGRK